MDLFEDLPSIDEVFFAHPDDVTGTPRHALAGPATSPSDPGAFNATGISQIGIVFSEDVNVSSADLMAGGTVSDPAIVDFDYDAATHTAIWTFSDPLWSDSFEFRVSDRISDNDGNFLDGEITSSLTDISGDGFSGGDAVFRISVLPGDVDFDGVVDSRDLALLYSALDLPDADPAFDINLDGVVDALDSAVVRSNMGGTLPGLSANEAVLISAMDDRNADAGSEIAVLTEHGGAGISVVDPLSGETLQTWSISSDFRYFGLSSGVSSEGDAILAFAGENKSTSSLRVWTLNTNSGETEVHNLGRNARLVDLDLFEESLYVLTETRHRDTTRLTHIDLSTGARSGLAALQNFVGTELLRLGSEESADLIVFGRNTASDRSFAHILDDAGQRLDRFNFGVTSFVDFVAYDTPEGDRFYAALRSTDGSGLLRALVKDADGAQVDVVKFAEENEARAIQALSDGRLALLASHDLHHDSVVYVTDLEGAAVRTSFGAGFAFHDMAVIDVQGKAGISVAQSQADFGIAHVKSRLVDDGTRIGTKSLFDPDDPNAWFMDQVAHGHTRAWANPPESDVNPPSWFGTELYDRVGEYMAGLGASVFTRHTVSFDEDPWWPSEWPAVAEGLPSLSEARENAGFNLSAGENILAASVANAWEADIPSIAYYAETGDQRLAEAFPGWIARDDEGNPIAHNNKGTYLDITGPYGEVVKQRILELADMGYSGIYLDFWHLPPGGLWGSQLQADYEAQFGIPAPDQGRSDGYEHYMKFYQQRMQETISGWEQALLEEYPFFQFIVSNASLPALTRLEITTDLAQTGTPKSEFTKALSRGQTLSVFENYPDLHSPDDDIRMAFGWALLRDAADGNKPHIWDRPSPNGEHLNAFIAALATYGSIAAVDVPEVLLAPGDEYAGVASRAEMMDAFEMANTAAPHLSNVELASNVAVLWDETGKHALYDSGTREPWETVNIPALAGFEAMTDLGLGPRVLSDFAIAEDVPETVEFLYVADRSMLEPDRQAALARFEARGGTVIASQSDGSWGDELGYDAHVASIREQMSQLSVPIKVSGLPDHVHAVSYQRTENGGDNAFVVAITNDFTFKQSTSYFTPLPEEDVVDGPDRVPAGSVIEIDKTQFPGAEASDLVVIEAISGERCSVVEVDGKYLVTLPEFGQFAVVTIDAVS